MKRVWMLAAIVTAPIVLAQMPQKPDILLGSDRFQAMQHVRELAMAEVTYASAYPKVGFACSLRALGGPRPQTAEHADLIRPKLASGKVQNYIISVACNGRRTPQTTFQVLAVPNKKSTCQVVFCDDETGVMKFWKDLSEPGKCPSNGERLVPGKPPC